MASLLVQMPRRPPWTAIADARILLRPDAPPLNEVQRARVLGVVERLLRDATQLRASALRANAAIIATLYRRKRLREGNEEESPRRKRFRPLCH